MGSAASRLTTRAARSYPSNPLPPSSSPPPPPSSVHQQQIQQQQQAHASLRSNEHYVNPQDMPSFPPAADPPPYEQQPQEEQLQQQQQQPQLHYQRRKQQKQQQQESQQEQQQYQQPQMSAEEMERQKQIAKQNEEYHNYLRTSLSSAIDTREINHQSDVPAFNTEGVAPRSRPQKREKITPFTDSQLSMMKPPGYLTQKMLKELYSLRNEDPQKWDSKALARHMELEQDQVKFILSLTSPWIFDPEDRSKEFVEAHWVDLSEKE